GGARNFRASGDAEGVLAVAAVPASSWDLAGALATPAITATKTTMSLIRLRMAPPFLSRVALIEIRLMLLERPMRVSARTAVRFNVQTAAAGKWTLPHLT